MDVDRKPPGTFRAQKMMETYSWAQIDNIRFQIHSLSAVVWCFHENSFGLFLSKLQNLSI